MDAQSRQHLLSLQVWCRRFAVGEMNLLECPARVGGESFGFSVTPAADPVDLPSRASPANSQKSRTRTIGRPPGNLHRLVAWTRSQKIDIDGLRHGLETSPVWMKEIAGAADRHVRLEGGFNSSSRRIQGGGIKIRHSVK